MDPTIAECRNETQTPRMVCVCVCVCVCVRERDAAATVGLEYVPKEDHS